MPRHSRIYSDMVTVVFQLWNYELDQIYNVFYGFAPLLLCSLSLFAAITMITKKIPLARFWNELAALSLGIYFVHNMVLKTILKYDVFSLKTMTIIKPLKVLSVYVVVFAISFCIVEVTTHFPKVSKILFFR